MNSEKHKTWATWHCKRQNSKLLFCEHSLLADHKVVISLNSAVPCSLGWHTHTHTHTHTRTRTRAHTGIKSFSSVQFSWSLVSDSMDCSTPGFPVHHQLPELIQTHVHRVRDAIQSSVILCHPLLLLPSIFPSIRVFSNESALCIRGPKY